jgi:hypothetical protein
MQNGLQNLLFALEMDIKRGRSEFQFACDVSNADSLETLLGKKSEGSLKD